VSDPLYPRRPETDDDADLRIDQLDLQLRSVLSELRLIHDRSLRLESAFIHLRQDVEAAIKKLEAP
jgi:hypothetical protein